MNGSTDRAHDPYAALRIPNFRRYTLGAFALTLSTQVQGIIVAWQIYAVTRDPLSLGLIGLAEALPFIGVALLAGHVADRVDRRRLALASTAVLLACSLALLVLAARPPAPHTFVRIVYGIIFVSGLARSFLQPARVALSSELVPRAVLPNAVTWRSVTWQTAAVGGPALGGLLYGLAGATAAYRLDAALMALAFVAFWLMRHRSPVRAIERGSITESLKTGLRFVRSQPVILGAMTLDLFSVLFGGAVALLPVFADQILHVGPEGLGVLRAAPAAGAVVMSLALAHRPPFRHAGRALLWVVALFGLCMIGFGLSRNYALSVVLLFASGLVDMVSVVIRSTLLQVFTPEHLLGRVSSVNQIFIGSSNEIGAFESGVTAKLFGTAPSVVIGGLATLAVVALTGWALPSLRRLGPIDASAGEAEAAA
jgi:MFS family permease